MLLLLTSTINHQPSTSTSYWTLISCTFFQWSCPPLCRCWRLQRDTTTSQGRTNRSRHSGHCLVPLSTTEAQVLHSACEAETPSTLLHLINLWMDQFINVLINQLRLISLSIDIYLSAYFFLPVYVPIYLFIYLMKSNLLQSNLN